MGFLDELDKYADYVPNAKLGIHSFQIIFGFVIFVLEIIVFRGGNATINGQNGWTFGLCFLSVPAWIYLIMTPRWERTRRAAHPMAMLVVDAVFAVLWLSGFATQAAYNTANLCGDVCSVSKGIVAMGFFEILLWIITTGISVYTMKYYSWHQTLPGYENLKHSSPGEDIDPDKQHFSASMAPQGDEEAYAPLRGDGGHDDHHEDSHGPYNSDSYNSRPMFDSEAEYRPHHDDSPPPHENPFDNSYRAHSTSPHNDYNAGYSDRPQYGEAAGGNTTYTAPTAEEYEDHRARFPSANYDRTNI